MHGDGTPAWCCRAGLGLSAAEGEGGAWDGGASSPEHSWNGDSRAQPSPGTLVLAEAHVLGCAITSVLPHVSHVGGVGSAGAGGARGEREGGDYLTPVRIASGCLSPFPPARMDMLRACGCVVAPVCGCRTNALSLLRRRHVGAASAEGGGGTMGA